MAIGEFYITNGTDQFGEYFICRRRRFQPLCVFLLTYRYSGQIVHADLCDFDIRGLHTRGFYHCAFHGRDPNVRVERWRESRRTVVIIIHIQIRGINLVRTFWNAIPDAVHRWEMIANRLNVIMERFTTNRAIEETATAHPVLKNAFTAGVEFPAVQTSDHFFGAQIYHPTLQIVICKI